MLYELLLGSLGSILGSALGTSINTECVEAAAHYVVSNAGEVPDTPTTYEHNGVLLKVVALTTDVGTDFLAVG